MTGWGEEEEEEEGGDDKRGGRRASTKRNDVNGWFICRDDEIARRYILSEGGNVCASSSVKSCRGSWTIVYTISPLLSYSLGSDVSSSVKSPMTSFRGIEKLMEEILRAMISKCASYIFFFHLVS